jgi:hypothetical protein
VDACVGSTPTRLLLEMHRMGTNESMSDVQRLDLANDAAGVVEDFVNGIIGVGGGEIGGGGEGRNWTQRTLGRLFHGEKQVAQEMGGQYTPEQLRKAADAADELVAAVDELGNATLEPAKQAGQAVTELGVRDIPATLRNAELRSDSPELAEVHTQLSKIIGVLGEARSRTLLAEMRGEQPGDPAP